MANPGPASTQTANYLFNGDSSDGIQIAGAASDLLAFHGAAPVNQAGAIADIANDANGTAIATAVNSILAALREKGLIASA